MSQELGLCGVWDSVRYLLDGQTVPALCQRHPATSEGAPRIEPLFHGLWFLGSFNPTFNSLGVGTFSSPWGSLYS